MIENLDGFTKENADNRMVKYLIEVLQVNKIILFPKKHKLIEAK